MVEYTYDTRDRLLTENASALTYDANGNLTAKVGEASYTWDHENRLIRVTKADGTVTETAYDADGNRLQTKVTPPTGPPTTTNYLVDTSGGLSHVVAETDAADALQALYVRGSDDLLSVMRPEATGGWTSRFFHADGIGSIRRLTDEAGSITDGYTYSAFGELLAHTGNDPQPYAFAGEPYDPNVGFQYHRARHYDSRIGRFLGMDPFAGIVFDPPTLHRYLYVRGDPANRADPTGEYEGGLSGALTTVAAQITLIGSRAVAGTITRLGAIRAIRALNWTFGILSAAYARFGNIFVQLEQGLERGTGRVDIVLRTAPQVVRRAVIEGKAWSLDAIAQAPGRAASMLDQLRIQAGNYAVEFGDDLVYAFPELPKTPAGQALLQEVQAILTSAGVQRVTFGVSQLMDEVATLLK
jgi:RHS repeat-associated protein